MKFLKSFKVYESVGDITINDVAWIYFLRCVWDGKMRTDRWSGDKRMGVDIDIAFEKFDFVNKMNGWYRISDEKKADKIINKYFGTKNFKEAVRKKIESNNTMVRGIPYDYFMWKNPNIETAFDRISDRIVEHFNSQGCYQMILEKLSRSRRLKEWNFKTFFDMFPDEPRTITLYRGIKKEYEPKRNEKGFSCWTTDRKQAERFARHHFTGGMQFDPIYSKAPHILTTEVTFDDVAVFIGGDESEVILRNPVNISNIEKIERLN